jgi:hypothetical protein
VATDRGNRLRADFDQEENLRNELERIAKDANFDQGQLVGFEHTWLHDNLTVSQYAALLDKLGLKATLGPENGRVLEVGWAPFPHPQGGLCCQPFPGRSCALVRC